MQFQYHVPLNGDTPTVGDAYTFRVTYSDSSSDTETLTPLVTGWNGSGSLVGTSDLATGLLPDDQGSLRPTFTWSAPAVDASDLFSYYLFDASGNTVWQVPGNNSNSNGFPNSIVSLDWGIDPTDASNDLAPGVFLTDLAMYSWEIQAQDGSGNQAITAQAFQASGFL